MDDAAPTTFPPLFSVLDAKERRTFMPAYLSKPVVNSRSCPGERLADAE